MRLRYPDPSPNLHALQPVSVRRLQSCTITAAAEKTTAAFFMGFPFTKIVVGNKNQIRWLRPRGPSGTFAEFNVDERPLV
jgi:hypothetical protein